MAPVEGAIDRSGGRGVRVVGDPKGWLSRRTISCMNSWTTQIRPSPLVATPVPTLL